MTMREGIRLLAACALVGFALGAVGTVVYSMGSCWYRHGTVMHNWWGRPVCVDSYIPK